jgi:two-component system, chemotaxis family, chemotaxis protein CheY
MKIVIADDSRVMRQIVLRTMRQAGYAGHDIIEATDGADALAKIEQHHPDLVLSDWNMPTMTGIDLLHALRSAGNQVPFGFVTSEGSPEMRSTAEHAGAQFLIAKPFTPDGFRDVLDPVIGGA